MIAFEEMHSFINSFAVKELLQRFVVQNLMMNIDNAHVLKTTSEHWEKNLYVDFLYAKLKCLLKKEDWIRLSFLSILYFEKKYQFAEKSAMENYNFGMVRLRELLWECLSEIAELPFYSELSKIQELNYTPVAETIKQFSVVDYSQTWYQIDSMNFISDKAKEFVSVDSYSSLPNALFTDFGIKIVPHDFIDEMTEEQLTQWQLGNATYPWVSKLFAFFKQNGMPNNVQENFQNLYQFFSNFDNMNGMNQLAKGAGDPVEIVILLKYFSKLLKKARIFSMKDAYVNGIILRTTPIGKTSQIEGIPLNFPHQIEFVKQFCLKYIFKESTFIVRLNLLLQQTKFSFGNELGFYGLIFFSEGKIKEKLNEYISLYGSPFADLNIKVDPLNMVKLNDFAKEKTGFLTFLDGAASRTRYFLQISSAKIPFNYDPSAIKPDFAAKDFESITSKELSEKYNFLGVADILHNQVSSDLNAKRFYEKIMNLNSILSIGAIYQNMAVEQALDELSGETDGSRYYRDKELFSSFLQLVKNLDNYKEAV